MRKRFLSFLTAAAIALSAGTVPAFAGDQGAAVVQTEENEVDEAEDTDPAQGRELAALYAESAGDDLAGAAVNTVGGSGLVHDSRYASMEKKYGIDVSKWDEDVDWEKVKAAGVDFAFIRLGFRSSSNGRLFTDPKAEQNLTGALKAGISVGVYIFSQAVTEDEAREEARQLMAWAEGYNVTLPFVMDYEFASIYQGSGQYADGGRMMDANLSKVDATKIVNAFADTVLAAGKTPAVYANKDFLSSNLNAGDIRSDCRIWLARWNNEASYTGRYAFWQYSATGKVDGISTNVDLDVWYAGESANNAMYRLYNPNSGEHFFTANFYEKNYLAAIGWNYEGIAWYAPKTGAPVYRLYNPNAGDHHYTASAAERDMDVSAGWRYEGVGWYTADDGAAMYRLYNPNARGAGAHHYTASMGERDYLTRIGWRYEGIGFYGVL